MTRTIHTTRDATGPGWAAYCRLRAQLETPLDWESAAVRSWWQSLHQPRHDAPEDAALDAIIESNCVPGNSFTLLGWNWISMGRDIRWAPETIVYPFVQPGEVWDCGITTRELRARLPIDIHPRAYDAHGNETGPTLDESVELYMPCTECRGRGWVAFAEQYSDVPCRQCGGYTETERPFAWHEGSGRVPRIEQAAREPVAGPTAGAQWCAVLHDQAVIAMPGDDRTIGGGYMSAMTAFPRGGIAWHSPLRRASHPDGITLSSGRVIARARLGKTE